MTLRPYQKKRDFKKTPEPSGEASRKPQGDSNFFSAASKSLRFVVQMHHASHLHFDFRLEIDGNLVSWAIPKEPSQNPSDNRLAVHVEDHPLEYGDFEGIIPKGNYGAGTVMIWDRGTLLERGSSNRKQSQIRLKEGIQKGHLTFILRGEKLRGEFALIHTGKPDQKSWLLVKKRDEFSTYKRSSFQPLSVHSGRTLEQIRLNRPADSTTLPKNSKPQETQKKTPPAASQKDSRTLKNPPSEPFPKKILAMIPTHWDSLFEQKNWIFEKKPEGTRCLLGVDHHEIYLLSKHGVSMNRRFPEFISLLRRHLLESKKQVSLWLDGFISKKKPLFTAIDLLHENGKNFRKLTLLERKKRLQKFPLSFSNLQILDHKIGKPQKDLNQNESFARAGMSPYEKGPSKSWLLIPSKSEKPSPKQSSSFRLTHLEKIYFPKPGFTKKDLLDYFDQVGPYLLTHLKDRPQSLHRFPNGVSAPGFFQKNFIGYQPKFVETTRVSGSSGEKTIQYLLCQNQETLRYMANLGCIEINPWLSRVPSLDQPDFIVLDLDPDDSNSFSEVTKIARKATELLKALEVPSFCKTSGSSGIHIFIPIRGKRSYEESRQFALGFCQELHRRFKKNTSLERSPSKRRGKIYLDCFQNARGQTIASIYSPRPNSGALVSTPVHFDELTSGLKPDSFTIKTLPQRLDELGDLWSSLRSSAIPLQGALSSLEKEFPIS